MSRLVSAESNKTYITIPWARFASMLIFIVLVAVGTFIDWPMGPMNLTWGAWIVGYGGYLVLWISTIAYLVVTLRRDD